MIRNIFSALPEDFSNEAVEELVRSSGIRIERIVSHGHSSPESGWYDQEESEWMCMGIRCCGRTRTNRRSGWRCSIDRPFLFVSDQRQLVICGETRLFDDFADFRRVLVGF